MYRSDQLVDVTTGQNKNLGVSTGEDDALYNLLEFADESIFDNEVSWRDDDDDTEEWARNNVMEPTKFAEKLRESIQNLEYGIEQLQSSMEGAPRGARSGMGRLKGQLSRVLNLKHRLELSEVALDGTKTSVGVQTEWEGSAASDTDESSQREFETNHQAGAFDDTESACQGFGHAMAHYTPSVDDLYDEDNAKSSHGIPWSEEFRRCLATGPSHVLRGKVERAAATIEGISEDGNVETEGSGETSVEDHLFDGHIVSPTINGAGSDRKGNDNGLQLTVWEMRFSLGMLACAILLAYLMNGEETGRGFFSGDSVEWVHYRAHHCVGDVSY